MKFLIDLSHRELDELVRQAQINGWKESVTSRTGRIAAARYAIYVHVHSPEAAAKALQRKRTRT